MPIFSYLAYPVKGARETLVKRLESLPFCEVIPSDNTDVLVLITDTPDEQKEKTLAQRLHEIKSLQSLHMTFGHVDK